VKATAGQDLEQRMERIERVIEEVLGYVEQAVKGIKQQGEKILKKSLPGAPS
jgi:predicted  nucleic acid-binding Zn-ribbon protein